MNLYLLIAIALGAITGVREMPVSRPSFTAVVAKSSVHAERRAARACAAALVRRRGASPAVPFAALIAWRADAPLTGAASPRAPSRNA